MPAGLGIVLLCLPLAAAAGLLGNRIGVPYPILLFASGIIIGLVPWIHASPLSPALFFFVFLPPLVYYAASTISPADLRADAGPIALLSVGLVLLTTTTTAATLVALVPAVPVAVAAVIGAVVAPTDPVAATAVFRRLRTPERLATIVEAEGLINDGVALVLFTTTVSAVVVGQVHTGGVVINLLLAPVGGAVLGLAVAWLVIRLVRRINDPLVEVTISLATPYLTYLLAQAIHLSGILATVAAGVYVGSRTGLIYRAPSRLQTFAFLETLVFLLNAILFALVGFELVGALHRISELGTGHLVAVLVAVAAVVIAVRLIWTLAAPTVRTLTKRGRSGQAWRERTVVGWAGMRGGVALAAALSTPLRVNNGGAFPFRDLVIIVAAAVIIATLLLQGLTLPWLLTRLRLDVDEQTIEQQVARRAATVAALGALSTRPAADPDTMEAAAVDAVQAFYQARLRRLDASFASGSGEVVPDTAEATAYRVLRLELFNVERATLAGLRNRGRISAAALRAVERGIDLEEARVLEL